MTPSAMGGGTREDKMQKKNEASNNKYYKSNRTSRNRSTQV